MDGFSGYWVMAVPKLLIVLVLGGLILFAYMLAYLVEFAHDARYFRTNPAIRNRWRRRAAEIFTSGGPTRR
jgi:hypothetical protein